MVVLLLVTSCSVKKHLPEGTYLYKGADITVTKTPDNDKGKGVKKQLKRVVAPRPNKTIFGFPYKVAIWYFIGEPKRPKGFRNFLRTRFGEAPVLSTKVDLEANAVNMQAYLENKGYFHSVVGSSKKIKGYKMQAVYKVTLPPPYYVNQVNWVLDSSVLAKDIARADTTDKFVKSNDQFDMDNIKAERNRIDIALKEKGYYYFTPDYLKSYVDTTLGNHRLNVFFAVKKDVPLRAKQPQSISSITLFPNYNLRRPDTNRLRAVTEKNIQVVDSAQRFKPSAIVRSVTYQPGQLYNVREHNKTLNRFINMGVFKFVKSRYEQVGDSAANKLDVYYYLSPYKNKNIGAEIAGFTKSNSFTGTQLNVSWKHRNLRRGAEQLNVKAYGAFELSLNDSLRNYNNWRVGGEVSLLVPRFLTPFKIKESSYFPPYTRFTLGYEWMRRQLLYTQNFFRFQYDVTWKESSNKEHTLAPVSLTYVKTTAFSPEYLQKINMFSGLRYTLLPELVSSSFYNYLYNSINPNSKNIFYINGNAEFAGNIFGLVNKPDTAYSKTIAGAYFSQYAKMDVDFRYTRKVSDNTYLANRVFIGAGIPYGNSAFLPFSRQYIIGGANSLRGFRPRQLGPGRVQTTAEQQVTYPQIGGDYKLEVNSELRFPLVSVVKGALFAEAGNIWTRNETLYGPGSKFTSRFMQDIAVDAGVGLRVDVQILIIRLDVAFPLRKPWLPRGQEWVVKDIALGNGSWRSENLIFNFGIGYPF